MTLVSPMATREQIDAWLDDPKANLSWYFESSSLSHLSIDIESVWQDYTGSGVKVGVVDSQIDFNHKELRDAYDKELDYSFAENTDDVSLTSGQILDTHGTMVAGVISGGAGNDRGSVGLAHDASLVGLAIDYRSSDVVDQVTQAIRAGVNVDVLNNSWSFTRNFADNFNSETYSELSDALRYVAENGRDGLGTSIVFSAGNAGDDGSSNYHNLQNSPYTIAVGGISADGDIWSGSSLGANILVSAGGDEILTSIPGNQYAQATGTSFAAPAVSAVIALMLEANPSLGYRDIQQILALSARKDGLAESPSRGDGWQTNGADTFNGGGLHYSDAFGYGMVNAHDAVRLAETWTQQQTTQNLSSVEINQDVRQRLEAGVTDMISFQIEVDQDVKVEHIQLSLDLRWSLTADLDVYLISPDGTKVRLIYDHEDSGSLGAVRDFTFTSVASMGEMSAGSWTVEVHNRNPDAVTSSGAPMTGYLEDVTLTVNGNGENPADDTYVYTDEFGVLYSGADLAARAVLEDIDGGADTINAAAVTSDSRIDLSGQTASNIAGVALTLANASSIENAFGGDGDDTLIGNAGDNWLKGGRGNDTLHLSAGADRLEGGSGQDSLVIDAVYASIRGYFTTSGTFMLGFAEGALSVIIGIEEFVFDDVTYSYSDMEDLFSDAEPVDVPADDPADEGGQSGEETPPEETNGTDTGADTGTDPGTDTGDEPDGGNTPPADEPDDSETQPPVFDEIFIGTSGGERLAGSRGSDKIDGGAGNDTLIAFDGDDLVIGGTGDDMLKGSGGADSLYGGEGDDRVMGGSGDDYVEGGAGNDRVFGGTGDDTLFGGEGRDVLRGEDGADTFVFDVNHTGSVDIVRDFDAGEGDSIVLTGLSGASVADAELVNVGSSTYLQFEVNGQTVRLAKIFGEDLEQLSITQMSDDSLLIV